MHLNDVNLQRSVHATLILLLPVLGCWPAATFRESSCTRSNRGRTFTRGSSAVRLETARNRSEQKLGKILAKNESLVLALQVETIHSMASDLRLCSRARTMTWLRTAAPAGCSRVDGRPLNRAAQRFVFVRFRPRTPMSAETEISSR